MGACESVGCASKKYAKPPRKSIERIVSRPTNLDLDSSMDEYEVKLERQSNLLAKKVDNKDAEIGVYFINDELILRLRKSHQHTATKSSRLDKWREMVQFGLDSESAPQVFLK